MILNENKVDVLYHLSELRQQRATMVKYYEQYLLVHMILYEYLLNMNTSIVCDEDVLNKLRQLLKDDIDEQLFSVKESTWCFNVIKRIIEDKENAESYSVINGNVDRGHEYLRYFV